jgi:hypothetical protein
MRRRLRKQWQLMPLLQPIWPSSSVTHFFSTSTCHGLRAIWVMRITRPCRTSNRFSIGGPNYLVYVNRSQVDVLRGMFGGIVRWFIEHRLKDEAAEVLQGLRRRLESGEPPPTVAPGLP